MPKRRWTDEELIEAVATSRTLADVMRALGLRPGSYEQIRQHIRRVGADARHLKMEGGRQRRGGWSDDDLTEAVATSTTYSGVMRKLGYSPSGGVHRWLKGRIRELGLSTDHFVGQAWARGLTQPFPTRAKPLELVLRRGVGTQSGRLRQRLVAEGLLKPECSGCGLVEWRGLPLPLMLDHINGDPLDNRLENLRILCPNCHSLTPTWCARNRKPA